MNHPVDLLSTLLECLDAEQDIPAPVRAWLRTGLRDYLRGEALERALGLAVGPGQAHAHVRNLLFRARRDKLIREVAGLLPSGSIHGRAVTIASALQTFGHEGRGDMPEEVFAAVGRLIFENGIDLPRSRYQIARILRGECMTARRLHGHEILSM